MPSAGDYTVRCVVCSRPIERDEDMVFANAWEASLGERPCCSAECKSTFRADVHWMPAYRPFASSEETAKLLRVASSKLAAGDDAVAVVRELLCAGVQPSSARHLLRTASIRRARTDSPWARLFTGGILGVIAGEVRDEDCAERAARASHEIDEWERRFGST